MAGVRILTIMALVVVACHREAPPAAVASVDDESRDRANDSLAASRSGSLASLYDDSGRPATDRSEPEALPPKSFDSRALSPPREHEREFAAPRAARRSIRLRDAQLDNVVTTLARLGGFDVVVENVPPTPITLDLDDVAPYDALELVAETHGLELVPHGSAIIVRAGGAPGKPAP